MRKPITVDDLWQFERIGAVALSPDGGRALATVTRHSMDDNSSDTQLWLFDTRGVAPQRPLTRQGTRNGRGRWSPRGDRIAFIARRLHDGVQDRTAQLYLIDPDAGEAWAAPRFGPGVEAFRWLPDGSGVVFASWVWPQARSARAQERLHKADRERKDSAVATSQAQYSHWDRKLPPGRVLHLLRMDFASGRITDLMRGLGVELPPADIESEPFDVSPDGRAVAFTFDPAAEPRAGNRRAIGEIDLRTRRLQRLADVDGWDFDRPRYHPDGRRLAATAAHVAVKHTALAHPALIDRRSRRWTVLAAGHDQEPNSRLQWSADGHALIYSAESAGRCHLWRHTVADDRVELFAEGGWVQGFDIAGPPGCDVVLTAVDSQSHPVRLFARHGDAAPRRLERFNDRLLARLQLGRSEALTIPGAQGDPVQLWLTYPPGFTRRRRHPVLHVIHGGPYIAAGDTFSYRWNPHALAARGHVVVQVNYHGSSGFGFAFRDSIVGQLAELELQDIEAATDWLLAQPWVDAERIYASGGSYGGFMVAWMNGHVPAGRYRAYVCHAGVFDRVATFAADSYAERPLDLQAWYYDDLAKVLAQSPHAAAGRMDTPMLLTHGALDHRVPDCNALACYNTLKCRGVDARLLWFPDENHWVLQPRNSRQWYGEVHAWLERHA